MLLGRIGEPLIVRTPLLWSSVACAVSKARQNTVANKRVIDERGSNDVSNRRFCGLGRGEKCLAIVMLVKDFVLYYVDGE